MLGDRIGDRVVSLRTLRHRRLFAPGDLASALFGLESSVTSATTGATYNASAGVCAVSASVSSAEEVCCC